MAAWATKDQRPLRLLNVSIGAAHLTKAVIGVAAIAPASDLRALVGT
jgi:hypothetical protein